MFHQVFQYVDSVTAVPGHWVTPLPDYLEGNPFVGDFATLELSHCQWKDFNRKILPHVLTILTSIQLETVSMKYESW